MAYGRIVVDGTPPPADEELEDRDAIRAEAAIRSGSIPFHGAAIESSAGVIVLAGVSGSGKSTLALAAALAGWGYVADEIAAVDPHTLHASPYHRPVGLRRQGADALGLPFPPERTLPGDPVDWSVDPERHSPGGIVSLIALVTWGPNEPTTCAPVEPVQAMVELMQHLAAHDDDIPWCFRAVETIIQSVPVVRLAYDDPHTGLDALSTHLTQHAIPASDRASSAAEAPAPTDD